MRLAMLCLTLAIILAACGGNGGPTPAEDVPKVVELR